MTEEQIKEQLSRHFIELIANRAGYKCLVTFPDHGCDLTITQAQRIILAGVPQYVETGRHVQIQLKSTCERVVEYTTDAVKYDLAVRTYNALVHRRTSTDQTPFLLVLLVLPDNDSEWVECQPDQLLLRKSAYWWYPEEDALLSDNASTVRITIPLTNTVDLDFVDSLFGALLV